MSDYHARDWCPNPAKIVTDSVTAHSPCVKETQNSPITGSVVLSSEVFSEDTVVITLSNTIDLSLGMEIEVAIKDVPIDWRFYHSVYIGTSYKGTFRSVSAPNNSTEGVESFWWDLDSTDEPIVSNVSLFGLQPGDLSEILYPGYEITIRSGLASTGSPPGGWSPELRIDRYRFFTTSLIGEGSAGTIPLSAIKFRAYQE